MEKLLSTKLSKVIFILMICIFSFTMFILSLSFFSYEKLDLVSFSLSIFFTMCSIGSCVLLIRKKVKAFYLLAAGFIGIIYYLNSLGAKISTGLIAYMAKYELEQANSRVNNLKYIDIHPISGGEIFTFIMIELPILLFIILIIQYIGIRRVNKQLM